MIARIVMVAMLLAAPAAAQSDGEKQPDRGSRTADPGSRITDPASRPPEAEVVLVRSSVSRTAVWVGDQIEFVVEFTLDPQMAVIADDLAKEKLKLEGLEVIATSSERNVADDHVTQRFRYVLSSYEPSLATLRIGSWPVRYYVQRPGERAEDVRPAGEVLVPAAAIARRSTLPDEVTSLDVRAVGGPADLPRLLRGVRVAGVALMLLAAAPLAIWTTVVLSRWRARTRRPRPSVARAHARSTLEELRAADADSDAGRRDVYARLERALRQHAAATGEIPAHALVSGELAARLQAAGSVHADAAGELLAECERAKYGPPDQIPPKERLTAALDAAEQIFAGARS